VTTTFLLVRHATHAQVGTTLCGRQPGWRLSDTGRAQADALAERLSAQGLALRVAAVRSSPVERALETAEPIAERLGAPLEVSEALAEVDFGEWTGRSFADLQREPRWHVWNSDRETGRPPEGECMKDVQARILSEIEGLRGIHREKTIVLVSHGDVIKAALIHHLGLALNAYSRFDIDPASVSTLVVGDWGAKVLRLNEVAHA
jgi:broad specificity phosphatase PhoE